VNNEPLIILAEDNSADVFIVRMALSDSSLGSNLRVLSDGEEALRFLADVEKGAEPVPDLWLLDLNLPKYSGLAVLEKIRASSKCQSLKVIVITSSNSPADRADAARLDAVYYFLKPNDVSEFLKISSLVREALEGRS